MKIAALVSGGVDSSVALAFLKNQGHNVTAFYLKIWLEDELSWMTDCPWQQDLAYVEQVCDQLDVPLKIISLQKEYHDQIVKYTIQQVKSGFTPNPDIMCNKYIKFGAFLDSIGNDYEKVASGHYAQVCQTKQGFVLKQSADRVKDQTYFLCQLGMQQLKRLTFPIGHLKKHEVREAACAFNLANKDRAESQGICFLGKISFKNFIKHHVGTRQGKLIEQETGFVLGTHQGFWYYTIGQRRGIGLSGGPWYVVKKDTQNNCVYISSNYFALKKHCYTFTVSSCNWFLGVQPDKKILRVKIRHAEQSYISSIDYGQSNLLHVTINERDQGIAAGQFAAFYDGDICLGGGIIE